MPAVITPYPSTPEVSMSQSTTRHLLTVLLTFAASTGLHAQAPTPDLSDPEVAHVAVTANSIDVELARFAQSRTHNDAVREFAATMIRDHTAVNVQAAALAGRLHVTPSDNAVSQSLLAGAAEARVALEPLHGNAFDRAYIDREVAYHQAVLDALDKVLIPTTSNADLRKLLVDVRPAIAAHLEHATHIRSSLGSGT
jgi:putative membrane protein